MSPKYALVQANGNKLYFHILAAAEIYQTIFGGEVITVH
jgi:hypothetical protein